MCPNCRSVADLEAELEDPFANNEWEEVKAADASPMVVDEPEEPPREAPVLEPTEPEGIMLHVEGEELERDNSGRSDEAAEISDESSQGLNQAAEDLGYLNIDDAPSPLSSTSSQPNQISNSTVAPVDISRPRGTHLEQPDPRTGRSRSRTPSPNGLPSSLSDAVTGPDGPMTPRNDAGPFVFDGSAGRASDVQLAALASVNLNAATENSSPRSIPQLEPQAAS